MNLSLSFHFPSQSIRARIVLNLSNHEKVVTYKHVQSLDKSVRETEPPFNGDQSGLRGGIAQWASVRKGPIPQDEGNAVSRTLLSSDCMYCPKDKPSARFLTRNQPDTRA
ncbi:hypothetical protein L873DRAFT_1802062 [Choiromyces venosus 120613-1]|uniref:Uncharacterized protein n=1 Tax=Choiromyces venosus 120613-1 TaxID=1336337 RepID=A0A3N4JZC2_9PEZI|nr:hypothetical protein L873DRAFT_1802062 [Choiromyces venosus 120613-1]